MTYGLSGQVALAASIFLSPKSSDYTRFKHLFLKHPAGLGVASM